MVGVLVFGFSQGDFWAEGIQLTSMPWGIVSLFDVYVGFLLFSSWIWYREDGFWKKTFLTISILLGGNAVSALYALIALVKSKGDMDFFFKGKAGR